MMRGLSVAGTAAMFLVGGGILVHGLPWLHHPIETAADTVAATAPWAGTVVRALLQAAVGVVAGALALASVALARRGPRGR
jgi:predicted DNA repair protein MutK